MAQEASQDQNQPMQSTDRVTQLHNAVFDTRLSINPTMAVLQEPVSVGRQVKNSASNGHDIALKVAMPSTVAKPDARREDKKAMKETTEITCAEDNEEHTVIHPADKPTSNGAHGEPVERPNNPFAKSASNPFAKSSVNTDSQSGVSFLDSIKRMRDTELDSKGRPNKSVKHS